MCVCFFFIRCEFPEKLDLDSFLHVQERTPARYTLHAVLVHSGKQCHLSRRAGVTSLPPVNEAIFDVTSSLSMTLPLNPQLKKERCGRTYPQKNKGPREWQISVQKIVGGMHALYHGVRFFVTHKGLGINPGF